MNCCFIGVIILRNIFFITTQVFVVSKINTNISSMNCCFIGVIILRNIFFITTQAFVVSKINTNSNVYYKEHKKYPKQHPIHCTRTTFTFISAEVLISIVSSILSVHSSTNLSINIFLHLQFE